MQSPKTQDIFLDPDTGLRIGKSRNRDAVSSDELIEIAHSQNRERSLVLVYDQSIDHRWKTAGTPKRQIRKKLRDVYEAGCNVHSAAYVSHIACHLGLD